MNASKGLLTSKTFWGVIIQLLALVLLKAGIDIGDLGGWVEIVVGLVGTVLAIVGRVKAVKRIE